MGKAAKGQVERLFYDGEDRSPTDEKLTDQLYQKIGRLEMDLEWLKKKYSKLTGYYDPQFVNSF